MKIGSIVLGERKIGQRERVESTAFSDQLKMKYNMRKI